MTTDLQRQPALQAAHNTPGMLVALLVASVLVIDSFIWQGDYGFHLGDEGFLWYGVQRVAAGEIPLLDFQSYDPGRYYWSAALMGLMQNDGIMALRLTVALFQLLGLFTALLLLPKDRSKPDIVFHLLAAVTLLLWMYPRHKLFDISLSIILIGVLTLLVQNPSRQRFLFAGCCVGLVAVFGRNHGAYGLAGIFGVAIYLLCLRSSFGELTSRLAYCVFGILLGYLPVLVMVAAVPGFGTAFWESIRDIVERGTSNLPLSMPWPWLVPITELPLADAVTDVLTGILFIALLAFGVIGVAWIMARAIQRRPTQPILVASTILALPYAQYAFSRADVGHLAHGIYPLLIGIYALMASRPRHEQRTVAIAMACASLLIMLPLHPGWDCRITQRCVDSDVAGSVLKVDLQTAEVLTGLKEATDRYAANGRSFLVTPLWPAAYAVFKRRSPVWEIYALFPRSNEFQRHEIERIKAANPGFALVVDFAVDGREDLRFRNTHPLMEQFIRDNFDPTGIRDWPVQTYQMYKPR